MHPSSIIAEKLFGDTYTKRFEEIRDARVAIKHHDFDAARGMLDGALDEYIDELENGATWFTAEDLAQALKDVYKRQEILNKKRQTSIAGAYMVVDRMLKEYKQKISEIGGEELTKKIEKQITEEKLKSKDISIEDGKKLYYEDYYGEYFEATPEDVLNAMYELNRTFQYMCEASLDDFYDMLGIKTDLGLGWSGNYIDYEWDLAYWIDMYTECLLYTSRCV